MAKPARKTTETTVSLGSDLRIGRAREVFNMLDAANKAAGKSVIVVIDAAEVSKIDTAGLQALTAATVRFRSVNFAHFGSVDDNNCRFSLSLVRGVEHIKHFACATDA